MGEANEQYLGHESTGMETNAVSEGFQRDGLQQENSMFYNRQQRVDDEVGNYLQSYLVAYIIKMHLSSF